MRIAIVYATDFARISEGGIQNFIRRIGGAAPESFSITYFGLGQAEHLPRISDQFVSLGMPKAGAKVNATFMQGLVGLGQSLTTYDAVIAHRAEHVLALPRRVPKVLTLHGGTWNAIWASNRMYGVLYPAMEAAANWRSTAVISVDPQAMSRLSMRAAPALFATRPPVDDCFRPKNVSPPRVDRLLTACRLSPEKRLDRLIRLASMMDWTLEVYGEGDCRRQLETLGSQLGANVEFRGAVKSAVLARRYSEGGVFCMSSQFEGFPLAAAEAAVAGLPILGVKTNGLRQLERFGAVSAPTISAAAALLERSHPRPANYSAAWGAFAAPVVASEYWRSVRRAACVPGG